MCLNAPAPGPDAVLVLLWSDEASFPASPRLPLRSCSQANRNSVSPRFSRVAAVDSFSPGQLGCVSTSRGDCTGCLLACLQLPPHCTISACFGKVEHCAIFAKE